MKKLVLTLGISLFGASAFADPPVYTDLGSIFDTNADYQIADTSFDFPNGIAATSVLWFKFTYDGTNGTTNYLDIDTINAIGTSPSATPVDTELGLYSSTGALVATDDDDGYGLFSRLTFGATSPTRQFTQTGTMSARTAANGIDGTLAAGTYWLAVAQFNTVFNATDWSVTSAGAGDADPFRLEFRTNTPSSVPEPASLAILGLGVIALIRRPRK